MRLTAAAGYMVVLWATDPGEADELQRHLDEPWLDLCASLVHVDAAAG